MVIYKVVICGRLEMGKRGKVGVGRVWFREEGIVTWIRYVVRRWGERREIDGICVDARDKVE